MKKALFLLTALCLFTSSFATFHVKDHPAIDASKILIPVGNTGKKISLFDLSKISRTDLETLTGKKMNIFEKLAFKKAQKRLHNGIDQNGIITDKKMLKYLSKNSTDSTGNATGFHVVGFLLGFLLNLVGVLLAYVINDDEDKRNRVKWAWIGFGVFLVLYIGLIVLILSSGGFF